MITEATTLGPVGLFGSLGRSTTPMVHALLDIQSSDNLIHPTPTVYPKQVDSPALSAINLWTTVDLTDLIHAVVASFSVILVSELGDKTFIITAIMAMKNSRFLVFLASALALFLMTVLSVGMGVAVTVIPDVYTHYASLVLFLCFGLKMLKEAYDMDGQSDEFDEVERSLANEDKAEQKVEQQVEKLSTDGLDGVTAPNQPLDTTRELEHAEYNKTNDDGFLSKLKRTIYVAPIIINVFTMILVAEWGDRSQISTVILAAREDTIGVFVGSFMGHVLCTGLAVTGGRFVANMISVRTMTLLGGIVFLFFAAYEIISGPEET